MRSTTIVRVMALLLLTFPAGACLEGPPYVDTATASGDATGTSVTATHGPTATETTTSSSRPGVVTVTTVATAIATTVATSTATKTITSTVTGVISGTMTATATVTYVQTLTNSASTTATVTFTATMTVAVPTSTTATTATQTGVVTGTTTVSTTSTATKTTDSGTGTQTGTGTGTDNTTTQTTTGTTTKTQTISGTGTATTPPTNTKTATNTTTATTTTTTTTTATNTGTPTATVTNVNTAAYPARVENPYEGAKGYVNPEWRAKADGEPGGSRVSNNPTAVWMDRIAAIGGVNGGMGLLDHLDEAVAQNAGYAQFVIYDLPGRDCAALASNGELGPTDIERYKREYIDPIVGIMADEKYAKLRIINIIEIDSLPNLVTNTGGKATATATCDTMKANGNYVTGIAYALGRLHIIPNTYNYIDAAHHGWIGWDDNFGATAELMATTAKAAEGGVDTVTGFITNTANYSPLVEPYLTLTETTRQSKWIDFNRYLDEQSFAIAFRTKLVSSGFKSSIGMLIDTSRNGWGGPARPTAASTATDVDTQVNDSRIDRRMHAGNWCNQSGAGLGERPKSVGKDGIHAYVWIKPPGESDGASQDIANDQGKGFDRMCDPTYGGNARNGNNKSGALPDAPLSGTWFSAQFQELMKNAYPPLE